MKILLLDGRTDWCKECESRDLERLNDGQLKCRACGDVWEQYGYSADEDEDHFRGER